MEYWRSFLKTDYWTDLLVDTLLYAAPASQLTKRIAEPYRGLHFAQYLKDVRPPSSSSVSLTSNADEHSLWQQLSIWKSHSVVHQQSQCLFFSRLPLDIRIMIYELVLGHHNLHIDTVESDGTLICHPCKAPGHTSSGSHVHCYEASNNLDFTGSNVLSILLTCRRAHTEGLSHLCSGNKFEFTRTSAAFRFFKLVAAQDQLVSLRHLRLFLRMPRHPLLNSRTKREWNDLFNFFSTHMPGLQTFYLHLIFSYPMALMIIDSSDVEGANWTQAIVDMASQAWRRTGCRVEIVTSSADYKGVIVCQKTESPEARALCDSAAIELHQRIRQDLDWKRRWGESS